MKAFTIELTMILLLVRQDHVGAFSPEWHSKLPCSQKSLATWSSSAVFMARTKKRVKSPKLSYAERLQLLREKSSIEQQQQSESPAATIKEGSPQHLAQQLVAAQRISIDMLTFIRQRVESLPLTSILESLGNDGFVVVDDFLASDDAIAKLQAEGRALFEEDMMATDLARLGSGEYVVTIKGGTEQYSICPRTIETVVSITKHLSPSMSEFNLDGKNCIANMRLYDRNSRLASLDLVKDEDEILQPFGTVADANTDLRKVSLFYYPIGSEWSDGGVTIERGNRMISAKRDRLILLLSDSCRHRHECFIGDEGMEQAFCLEVHLLARVTMD